MALIQVLDKAVAELIAAGEVVERPASIAKELIENAIDAGATSISVEIEDGGIRLLRVSDNGVGILREDVPRAFLRHATSKIRDAGDLDSILTLGFRGEALASIAAMCRVELTTKTAGELEGTLCRAEGGQVLAVEPAGCPTGTTITVRDVFYNTPARMKFLKKNTSEGSAVAQVVDKCALSHPEIAFRFARDGQVKLQTSGNGDLLSVIHAIYGREMAAAMIPVDYVFEEMIGVRGYISSPGGVKPSRTYQNFFINGRFVRTRTAMAALEEAYKNKIMSGRFPACVLNLELDAATVDVNVHPAKTEVRFAQEKPVFSAVYFAAKSALAKLEVSVLPGFSAGGEEASSPVERLQAAMPAASLFAGRESASPATPPAKPAYAAQNPTPQRMTAQEFRVLMGEELEEPQGFSSTLTLHASDAFGGKSAGDSESEPNSPYSDKIPCYKSATISPDTATKPQGFATVLTEDFPPEEPQQLVLEKGPAHRVIGELFDTYILLEKPNSLVLVDKHAAHERLLYERLKESLSYGNRQVLLSSLAVVLPKEDYAALLEGLDVVEKLGFGVEDFGDGTVLVREIPIELHSGDIESIIAEIADKLRTGRHDLTPYALDRLYYSIACKSALRAGDKNTTAELLELVELLAENPQITHCPHGRPVLVELTRYEVEKLFGRQG